MALLKYEVSKELQDKAAEALELARKGGKIKKGSNEVTKVIERGVAKLVVIAEDTNPLEIVMHIPILCEEKGVPCLTIASREELGNAAGLNVSTSSVVVIQEGEAKNLIKEITEKISQLKE